MKELAYKKTFQLQLKEGIRTYIQLLKLRLSLLVAISAGFGYAMGAGNTFSWQLFGLISLGGLLITGASNTLNQLLEKDYDALMNRTANRPFPMNQVSVTGALLFALILLVAGVSLLGYFFNLPAALLGIIGLLLYAFVYTPMKRMTPLSVFVGAIPGSLPPLIGWVAATGSLGTTAWILFAFQFLWQFPHFWAIAWLLDEDYRKAGFKMLPYPAGKCTATTRMILVYTLCLVPLVLFPLATGMLNIPMALVLASLGLGFAWPAWKLHQTTDNRYAKKLMFASFLYLPLMEIVFVLNL